MSLNVHVAPWPVTQTDFVARYCPKKDQDKQYCFLRLCYAYELFILKIIQPLECKNISLIIKHK